MFAPADDTLTFGHLLVQSLLEDVLVNILDVDEVGVVGVDKLFEILDLLYRDRNNRHLNYKLNIK